MADEHPPHSSASAPADAMPGASSSVRDVTYDAISVADTQANTDTRNDASPGTFRSIGFSDRDGGDRAEVVKIVMDDAALRRSLTRISHEIVERHEDLAQLYLVAIPNGGVPLGRILQQNLVSIAGVELPLGILDTTLYRDDLSRSGERPMLRPTEMPSSVDDRIVVVVEDVVSTGRTIRAAMDAMMDFGRPKGVQVVALVDRGHRELPIKVDYVGKNIPTAASQKVRLREMAEQPEGRYEVVVMEAHSLDASGRSLSASRTDSVHSVAGTEGKR